MNRDAFKGNQYVNSAGGQNAHHQPPTDEERTYLLGQQFDLRKQRASTKTADKIAKEQHITSATVRRAAEYSRAVDRIVANTMP